MNVATYKWKVHSGKIEIISFCRILWYLLFQAQRAMRSTKSLSLDLFSGKPSSL